MFILEKFEAIGTFWWIELFQTSNNSKSIIQDITLEIKKVLSNFDENYSRFLDSSILTKLNKKKELEYPSDEFLQILTFGEKLRNLTKGHFNLSSKLQLDRLGYDSKYSFESTVNTTESVDFQKSNISPFNALNDQKIELKDEYEIEIGAIGKGYLIDKVSSLLKQRGFENFLINGGGDLCVNGKQSKKVYLEHPTEEGQVLGSIDLRNKSLCSSSPRVRKWRDKNTGGQYHHLLNMRSGMPAQNSIQSVFTIGKTALQADAASTCIFVSPEGLRKAIAKELGVEYLILFEDRRMENSEGLNIL